MRVVDLAVGVFCCLVLFLSLNAQETEPPGVPQPGFSVGEIDFSSLRWGRQTAQFEVTNNTDELKFVTVETEVKFTGSYLNPNRRTRSHYVLKPLEARILLPAVHIPGNYGRAEITIYLYDVVDTLDITLPGQKFFEQPFTITFHVPEQILPYVDEKIDLPPMVERHPNFDNEFARILLILLSEGRSADDIAAMAKADTSFVQEAVKTMLDKGYVKKADGSYRLTFPFISIAEAEEAKKLAVALSDSLATVIENNMPSYTKTLDSLISAGAVDQDSNAFFDGGTVLYRPYPVVSALFLWFDLGRKFITRSAMLLIYDGTDLCNAHIPNYMYAVCGGDTFNGTQFYAQYLSHASYRIVYGDQIPVIDCGEDFILKAKLGHKVAWGFTQEFLPESFMLDTLAVQPVLDALGVGADSLVEETYYRLNDIATKHGHEKLSYGERYWFWNLAATHTLKKLVDRGVVTRHGNGQFKFDSIYSGKG